MARIIASRCVLAVRDLGVSTDYFTRVLGFERESVEAEGWSFLTRDNFMVMLGECPDVTPAAQLGDHSYVAYLFVEGVDQFYEELVGRGAILTSTPTDEPWGLREFGFRTPDGHRIKCGQPIAA